MRRHKFSASNSLALETDPKVAAQPNRVHGEKQSPS